MTPRIHNRHRPQTLRRSEPSPSTMKHRSCFKRNSEFALFIAVLTICYGLLFVIWEFADMPFAGFSDFMTIAFQWSIVTLASFPLFLLLSLNKYLFAISFPIIALLSGVFAYFRQALHITLTPMLIDLVLVNDIGLGIDLISWKLLLFVATALLYASAAVYWRWCRARLDKWWIWLVASLCLLYAVHHTGRIVRPVSNRMPASFYYVTETYIRQRAKQTDRTDFTETVHRETDTLTIVVVLGESLRADHLQLNGYARPTTPYLAAKTTVHSLPHLYSKEVFTHTSLPVLLTRADSMNDLRARTEKSFITLFRQAGFRTVWLANQEPVDTYSDFMHEADTLIYANGGKNVYMFDKWLDDALLTSFQYELEQKNPKKLLVLHTIGSHWWYNSHFEEAVFSPVLGSRIVSANSQDAFVNSYDNTIRHTDRFLHQLIEELQDKTAILIYVSDHGESLGENGKYLHAEDNEPLHYPAAFVWYSPQYARTFPDKTEALKQHADQPLNTGFLFHSALDAGTLHTVYLDTTRSIFRQNPVENRLQ